jgi:hypothetical protein
MLKKMIILILATLPLMLAANLALEINLPNWNPDTRMEDAQLPLLMKPGNPSLPFYPVKVLLPMGEKVTSVEFSFSENASTSSNVSLDYVRTPQPISLAGADETVKNSAVWQADAFYPSTDYEYLGTQRYRGYDLAVINIYPWHYNPVTGIFTSYSGAELTLHTESDAFLRQNQDAMLIANPSVQSRLADQVINPEQTVSYVKTMQHTPNSRDINPDEPKQLIIITSQNRVDWFTDYVLWKNNNSIPSAVFTIESIYDDYAGVDNAAKLRNFIIDAYQTWNSTATPLEYVILAGDDEIIPIRGVYGHVGNTVDNWMPCDLYYECLDGTWNQDGDDLWGEYPSDDPDLLPELYVGRFPAETQSEFNHIMDKTQSYINNTTFSNNIAVMFGENLNWNPVTWGGDYKDDVAQYIPAAYQLQTHYQRDGTYSGEIVWNSINSGAAIMNHMGHANEVYLMGQGNNTVEALQNTEYGFLYTQGCYPAAFDQRTSGDGESIGEHFVTAEGGLYAFIGNTRYGWYMPGDVNGPSEYFDRQFFNGMFQYGNFGIGEAMEFSLMQNLNYAMQEAVMLWCYYETILFGDPSTEVKLPNPDLPCLDLEDYTLSDIEGDNDGNLNPGEIVRLYPRVRNLPGWNTAYEVLVEVQDMYSGVSFFNDHLDIPQLPAGAYIDTTLCIRFQLPNEMPFGTYNFKIHLAAYDPGSDDVWCDRTFNASMEITLLDSHFPWDCFYAGKSAPVVGDLQFNNDTQILYVDVSGDGYFINRLGQQVGGFDFGTEENINRSFAMGINEIINTPIYDYAFTSRTGKIFAIAHKDSMTINYINYDTGSTLLFTPVIADIDNNGASDVIAGAHNKKIYVLDYDNELLPGFPVELSGSFSCDLAVADLDGNNTREIIAGTADGKLWAVEYDGSIKSGFPVQLSGAVTGSPIVLDNNRIVAGTHNTLYVVNPDGTIMTTRQVDGDMAGGAIPVDINRDGELDIVFVTTGGILYACRQDGSDLNGFPVETGAFFNCPPLAADIDGDFQYEIILQSHLNCVFIYNNNGTTVPGFPFTMNFNGSTPATLTDFDGDGNYELVSGYSNGVLVIKLRRPVGVLDAWTVYRGSLTRDGSYAATGFVGNEDEVAVTDIILSAAYPNPFNPETTISFTLPERAKQVSLVIYNIRGQKVKTLYSGSADKGRHSLVWNGRDDNNKNAASGVYFYRLVSGGQQLSRKMLLLK